MSRETPFLIFPMPAMPEAGRRFLLRLFEKQFGQLLGTTPPTSRRRSTAFPLCLLTRLVSGAPSSSKWATTKWLTPSPSRRVGWCCGERAWATPVPFSSGQVTHAQNAGPARGRTPPTLVKVAGTAGWVTKDESKQFVTDDYVPVGSHRIRVASARAFKAGDTVIVRRVGNQDWIDAMGMNGDTPANRWSPFNVEWDRVVTDVQGNIIMIDAPITCAIEKRWGGGEVIKYDDPGRIENVGIENLRGMSEFDPTKRTKEYGNMDRPNYVAEEYYADEDHYWNFITFDNIRNGWVRNVTALHFAYSMVGTQRGAKRITVQDCVSREPVSRRMGARRFTFGLRGELTLVQRCHSDKGRHSFMMGQPTRHRTYISIAWRPIHTPRAKPTSSGQPAVFTTTSTPR